MRNDLTVLEQGEHLARRQELVGAKPWRPNKGDIMSPLKTTNEVAVELAEIDENLMRNDLTVLEQGEHLARRQELVGWKNGMNQHTVGGGETVSPPKSTPEIAKEIGLTAR